MGTLNQLRGKNLSVERDYGPVTSLHNRWPCNGTSLQSTEPKTLRGLLVVQFRDFRIEINPFKELT